MLPKILPFHGTKTRATDVLPSDEVFNDVMKESVLVVSFALQERAVCKDYAGGQAVIGEMAHSLNQAYKNAWHEYLTQARLGLSWIVSKKNHTG